MSGGKRGTTITKQKWTEEEEAALRAGVEKYEVGKWRHIQKDDVFGPILKNRSNVDLKDKWRNLNMDSAGSRRDGRGSGDRAGSKKRRRKRQERSSEPELDDDDAEYIAGRVRSTSNKRRRASRRNYNDDPDVTFPEPTPEPVPVTEESILAAMIQLQDPRGSDVDAICQWLEENYGASSAAKRTVKQALKQMMEVGRITCRNGLYMLAGIPQQLVEESSLYIGDEDDEALQLGGSASTRAAREAAEAAARAVQEAEEAAELAAELIAAADRFDRGTPAADPAPAASDSPLQP